MKLSSREYKILTDEIKKVEKAESRLLFRRKKRKDESPGFIRKKIPEKTYLTLESAFEKAFRLIFNKGGGIIEKTSQLEKIRLQSEEFEESMHRMVHEGTIKAIDNLAASSAQNSKLIGTADGSILGIAGMGLPDIPIFLGILLKTCYGIAAGYGFDYRDPKEKKFTISVLKMAFSTGEAKAEYSRQCDELARAMVVGEAVDWEVTDEEIKEVSSILATDMLVAKFIQGFTLVGVVGGIFNYRLVHKINVSANLKYKKRFLLNHLNRIQTESS